MNGVEYYNRQKEAWSDKELQDIRDEYETKEMTISQIADVHHRTPGSISYKLRNLGLITHNTESRGYLEYRNSILYKQIVETGKINNTAKKETKLKAKTEILSLGNQTREMLEIRNEIADLKKDVKEMLRLMNALYDFENQ
jgi:glutamate mutase epsilon subunit